MNHDAHYSRMKGNSQHSAALRKRESHGHNSPNQIMRQGDNGPEHRARRGGPIRNTILPYTPVAQPLGLQPVAPAFLLMLAAIVACSIAAAEFESSTTLRITNYPNECAALARGGDLVWSNIQPSLPAIRGRLGRNTSSIGQAAHSPSCVSA